MKVHSEAEHGPVYGANAHIRKRIDYSYHTNYTMERQQWQDKVIQLRCLCNAGALLLTVPAFLSLCPLIICRLRCQLCVSVALALLFLSLIKRCDEG